MHLTGDQNLIIGLTGIKKKRGAHLSYMFLSRAAGLYFSSFTLFTPPPLRTHTRLLAAAAVTRSTRHQPSTLPAQAAAMHSLRHHRSRSARASRATRVLHRPHLLFAAAAACHSTPPP